MIKKLFIHHSCQHLEKQITFLIDQFDNAGEYVVKGDRNIIKRNALEQRMVSIKFFKKPSFLKSVVYGYFRESKAKRSFDYANILLKGGVSTPMPIAYYEEKTNMGLLSDSYYLCEHIEADFTFRELIHNPLFPDREVILKQFTAFTYKMHEHNVNFLDHSPGNTLIKKLGDNDYQFYLIDLNRMKFERMSISKRMENFKKLWLSKTMVKIISREYANLNGNSHKELFDLLMKFTKQFKRKITKKKYLKRKIKKV